MRFRVVLTINPRSEEGKRASGSVAVDLDVSAKSAEAVESAGNFDYLVDKARAELGTVFAAAAPVVYGIDPEARKIARSVKNRGRVRRL